MVGRAAERMGVNMTKKVFGLSILLVLLLVAQALAGDFAMYKTITSSALIYTGKGYYHGIKVNTDGTNSATVVVYDNTSGTGTVIDPSTVYTTSASSRVMASGFSPPLYFRTGLYIAITCSGTASVTVYYEPR